MAARFTEVVIDCVEPARVAEFWRQILDYRVTQTGDDGEVEIGPPDGGGPTLVFVRVPEPKSVKNRVHVDVNPSGNDQAAELERLLALGARQIDVGQGDVTWVVLADPEGNEFCLLRPQVA
jgi:hypothetical protein